MRLRPAWLLLTLVLTTGSVAARELPDFTRLAQKHTIAVVNISTTQRLTRDGVSPGVRPGGPYPIPPKSDPEEGGGSSLGSGFIISDDGYILTCAHVVADAREIVVRLNDRREFRARLIGADPRSDVALLKIPATGLPKVTLGNPKQLAVGEWVLAIGSPFGFVNSVTSGIVSAKNRTLPRESYVSFLQTDVATNPGNSGGPLFNLRGEVIGINAQIVSADGGFNGMSFAIPIDFAMSIADQLKRQGRVRRGWIGVSLQDVTQDLASAFGLDSPRGALVADIAIGGPASKSELLIGDIVVAYQGRAIRNDSDLAPLVGLTPPGTRAELRVHRHGQGLRVVNIRIGELRDDRPAARVDTGPARAAGNTVERLGLALSEPPAALRRRLGFEGGVHVDGVDEGPARDAGLLPGDLILEVAGQRVASVSDFHRLVLHHPRQRPVLLLRIRRGEKAQFLVVRPDS
ncbi:MAG: Do family serine endopeptidase [Pseudomonadota bacterium]